MKTVNIKGKKYVEVSERLKEFRENPKYKGWSLRSEIISCENDVVVMKAVIVDAERELRATGHAYEEKNSSYINKTSYIENCETSAWGRALGNLGIGIDTGIASAEEMRSAKSEKHKYITLEQKNILKSNIGAEKYNKLMAECNGKLTEDKYYEALEENEGW